MTNKLSTRSQILSIGKAGLISRALAIVVPMVLVRLLNMEAFGQYRLLWLVGGTALLLASLGIPKSLLYFVPRSDPSDSAIFVHQTIMIVAGTSLVAALFAGPWNPWLPDNIRQLSETVFTVPTFVFFWALSSIMEVLPNADQRIAWQVRSTIAVSVFRALVLILAAVITRDLEAVLLAMIAVAVFRFILLAIYSYCYHGLYVNGINRSRMGEQIRYAIPTGIAGSMDQVRRLGEQWVIALLFNPAVFGVFSVAATVLPLVSLVRRPVQVVILPKMSRSQSEQDIENVTRLNRRGNVAVSLVLLPTIGFMLVSANSIMTIMFGQDYMGAGSIFRVYLLGVIPHAVEVGTVLFAFAQTRFVMNLSIVLTVISLIISIAGAILVGPPGAALGSVFAGFAGMAVRMRRAISVTGMPLAELQDWSRIGAVILSVIISMIAAIVVQSMVNGSGVFELFITGIAFAAAYTVMLLMLGMGWVFMAFTRWGKWVDLR